MLVRGDSIGEWTLDAPLGQGGFATVWRAHTAEGRVGALKVLLEPESRFANDNSRERRAEQRIRLRREAAALSGLDHPNVVGLLEIVEGERLAIVTDLVEGPTLSEWTKGGPYTSEVIGAVFSGIMEGVEAAHIEGWVHRDLKPSNILLEQTDPPTPRVADFGLAHFSDATRLTRSGSVLGTPSYMAPEQVRDPSRVEPSSDLFALGAILFEMWCDRPAFLNADVAATLQQASAGLYPDPRLLRPDLPEAVAIAIAGTLEPDPERRIPDCATLRAVLNGTQTWIAPDRESAPTTMVLTAEPSLSQPARVKWALFVGSAALVAAVVAGVFILRSEVPQGGAIPRLSAQPDVQATFESAWNGWHEAKLADAGADIETVLSAEPERVWAHLLQALIYTSRRYEGDAQEALVRAAAALPTDPEAASSSAPALVDALRSDLRGTRPALWASLADTYPEDTVVQAMACIQLDQDRAAVRTCRRAEAIREVPLLDFIRARDTLIQGDLDSADDHLNTLFSRRPANVHGMLLRVDWLEAKGRWDEALQLAERAVVAEPDLVEARLARASARADAGDLDGARVDFEAARADATGAARLLAASQEAQVELGLGRVTRPLDLLRDASRVAEADGRWGDVVFAQTRLGWLAWYLRDADQLHRSQETLSRAQVAAAHSPKAMELEAHRAYLSGLEAIVRGDGATAGAARRHLQELDVAIVATVERETAIDLLWAYELALEGELDRLMHIASRWEFCEAQAGGGAILQAHGRHEMVVERFQTALEICAHTGIDRFFRFIAAQGLAIDAVRRGDPTAEKVYRAEMARLWPDPERPHPRIDLTLKTQ